ncbi:lamin tail domain-containing protein [Candidatus Woesearchaeota archaeon]|nr:lamin tail domain-containing protein [Candidatus Woesearchaeota archaeon]
MKKILLILLVLLLPNLVSAVEIYQIFYDPANSESGGESIEFYNPHPFDIDISGWIVATESSMKDAIFPANSTIPANGYFLLADNMWDERKDNLNWRSADFMTPITLNNEDSGIALINSSGEIVDAVGWGNPDNIDNNLFAGTPCNDAPQSKALLRIDSTKDNSNDFIIAEPDFFGDNVISIEVNVTDSSQSSAYILESGSITPSAGTNTTIHVRAGELMTATLFDTTKVMEKVDNNSFEAVFSVPYYKSPGNYSILFSDNSKLGFEIKELKSFKVISDKISFNVVPGSSSIASNKARIINNGNTDLVFSLDLITDELDKSLFQFSLNNDDFVGFSEQFEIPAGKSSGLHFKIEIPEETELGSYQSLITITAE